MAKIIDRTGHVYGRWTLLSRIPGKRQYICRCECGVSKAVAMSHLRQGKSKSCGCLEKELASARSKTHGMSGTVEYQAWINMRDRCSNPSAAHYDCYGGRGITVCCRWVNSFENFYEDMGPRPSTKHSIDRIDVNGNYQPQNCRWVTSKEQNRNTRTNTIVQYLGQGMCIAEAAELSGISQCTLSMRVRRGWDASRLFAPVRSISRSKNSRLIAA